MRNVVAAGILALIGALLITRWYPPKPLETQLLSLQVAQAMPEFAEPLMREPAQLQALFLTYADDTVLLAKARIALLRYPDIARPLFSLLGDDPAFRDALRNYGEDVLLPIHYFLTNDVFTLTLFRGLSDGARSALQAWRRLLGSASDGEPVEPADITPLERARYAVLFVNAEGYDFLGQFVMNARGDVAWVQTERVLEGLNSLFAGGIKSLESKVRRDESVGVGDVGQAALDVAIGVGALKLLRMGRAGVAAGGQSLTLSQRTAVLGAGLWRTSAVGVRIAKYGAPALLAYIAIRHPSVINSLLRDIAESAGLPVPLVQFVGWTLVLLPVFLLLRLLLRPAAWLLAGLVSLLRTLDRRTTSPSLGSE